MRQFPSIGPDENKTCSACSSVVARQACHRNRYGEYICHGCQAKGTRFTWPHRVRHHLRASALTLGVGVGVIGMAFLSAWVLYFLVYQVDLTRLRL